MQRFEDLKVWQKSQDLAVSIYNHFSNSKDYGFRDQITRASVSISNNIAEGFERKTNLDFKRFLYFSLASNSEVRSMLYLSERLNYLNKQDSSRLINETNEVSKMLYAFIKSMK
ncbi:four helix bundle protein [Croceitalea rosinachiae]|uniref:Four helix bundle protein n=1 Tax=Croceitalea rosinachiae TaxID=3075596 RepID=A0ABU3AC44_9FLAO|nr:four helix bundle protein [Croceitalea sp. F388]MDT0606673.1 four helix bundle protein [Croceitalea sp. F388]